MDKKRFAEGLMQEVKPEVCQRVAEYTCWKLENKEINPNFCQGDDPGFCQANRVAMASTCSTDADCNPYVPQPAKLSAATTCCSVWREMQPCVMSDEELEKAAADHLCSNNTADCSNPVSPPDSGDTFLQKVHCFFSGFMGFIVGPCET